MSHKPFTLAMVVPCYNEEEVLPQTKVELEKLLHKLIQNR